MSDSSIRSASERWFRLLLRLYPVDFRDEMGEALVETYLDRQRYAAKRSSLAVAAVCASALIDSVRNGVGERLHSGITWRRSGDWGRDMERVVRRLVRAPLFTLSVLGTMTTGLGAFAVVYAVVDGVLLAPLAFDRPDDLYFVWRDYNTLIDLKRGWLSGPDVAELDAAGGPIADAAGIRRTRWTMTVGSAQVADPEEVRVMLSTDNLFELLGQQPMLGRGFASGESGPGRAGVVVLGHALWQRSFGANPDVLNTDIKLNGESYRVIGVMGPDFNFVRHSSLGPPEGADLYATFQWSLAGEEPRGGAYAGLIRAKAGASAAEVNSAVAAVGRGVDERHFAGRGVTFYAVGLKDDLVASVRPALVVLVVAGTFLVLVLALNLASLLIARVAQREREFAVSRALGANALAVVRATILEAVLLGTTGGTLAALAAVWGTRIIVALAPLDLPRRESIVVNSRVALVIVGVGAILGLLAGAAPALWASRTSLNGMLRNAALRGGGRSQARRAMIVIQVALSLVLLSAGGLVGRSFARLLRSRPGFDPNQVLTFRVPVAQWRYPDNASAVALHERLTNLLLAIPGVASVSAASALPLTANTDQSGVVFPGAPGNNGDDKHDQPLVDVLSARERWFETLGIRLESGRDFGPTLAGARREAIIDRTLAALFFPTGGAVGMPLVMNGDTLAVVGVVDHARQYDLHRDGRPQVYRRDADDTYGALYFAIRGARSPRDLVPDVQRIMRQLDPQLALSDVQALDDLVSGSVRLQRTSAVLIAAFSMGALLLTAMGLFGVVAGSVVRRRHEVAVRLALGAARPRILRLLISEGATLVGAGMVLGLPGLYVGGRLLGGVLVGISPFDPATLVAVAAVLAAIGLLACYLPARRVGAINPAQTLREG